METRTALFTVLPEPNLRFGPTGGKNEERHDPQCGLLEHGPYSLRLGNRWHPSRVVVYPVASTVEWTTCLEALRRLEDFARMDAKSARVRADFPGFSNVFRTILTIEADQRRQSIPHEEFAKALATSSPAAGYKMALMAITEALDRLGDIGPHGVVFLQLPADIVDKFHRFDPDFKPVGERPKRRDKHQMLLFEELLGEEEQAETLYHDLRRSIKAICMRRKVAIQLVTSNFVNEDEDCPWAGKLWNISTSIFCKAGGLPWRLATDEDVAYCGVRFGISKSGVGQSVLVGLAQLVNASGELVALQSGQASRGSRRSEVGYYLTRDQARTLMIKALRDFESVVGRLPQRVVVHKSSPFKAEEIDGMEQAASGIRELDLVYLKLSNTIRLLPDRGLPADRGSMVPTTEGSALLYTCGNVPQFSKWRGMHVPRPLEMVRARANRPLRSLAVDVLRLTKMDWNSTVYDPFLPCTFANATEMIGMMKELRENEALDPNLRYYI